MRKLKSILICILTVISVCCLSVGLSACDSNTPTDKGTVDIKVLQVYSTEFTLNVGASSKIEFAYGGEEKVEFISSNAQVVTVDNTGVITGVSDGKTTVKVKAGKDCVECRISVIQTEYGVNIGSKELVVFTGTTKTITATAVADGVAYNADVQWSVTNESDCTVTAKNNVLKFLSTKVGMYVVTAKTDKAESSCVIKVVEKTATRFDAPVVSVEDCKTLKWNDIDGVSAYAYSVNFGAWQTVSAENLQVSVDDITKDLLYNETAIFSVKALATDNFANIDSVPTTVYFKHAYTGSETQATCVKEGVIEYTCSDCDKKYTNESYMPAHNYVSGVCSECKGYQTLGVTYMWDDALKCYFLAGVTDPTLEVLHVAGTYNDGKHGEAPVSYVKASALSGNKTILHVTLPESVKKIYSNAFMDMELRSIMILGIERLYGSDSEDYSGINHFLNSFKLEKLIVRKNFTSSVQSFVQNTKHFDRNMSIYVMERGGNVSLAGKDYSADAGLCNGNVYYMDETGALCQSWMFDENGYDIIFNDTAHNYVKGECVFCGTYDSYGIKYAFDSEKQCYYVAKNGAYEGKVAKILAEYNDGETGVYPVKYVAAGAFMDNPNVETVVLPESVTSIGGNAFFHMNSLHTLIMPGVELVQSGEGFGMNHIVRVNNLRNLVVKKDFVAKGPHQIFVNDADGTLRSMDVYAMEQGGTISIGGTNQNLFSGNIYYYDETLSMCDTWCFAEDGYTVVKSANTHDFDQNGDCKYCDEIVKTVEKDGFTFNAASDRKSYILVAYNGEQTEVIVPEKVFNKPVSGIGGSAFWTNTAFGGRCTNGNITKVTLPDSVTFLGGSAFRDQKNLTTVIMPGVTKIDVAVSNMQFHNCVSLKSVVVGESLEITKDNSLGDGANRVFAYDASALEEGKTAVEVDLFISSSFGSATYFQGNGWTYYNGMLSPNRTYNYSAKDCLNTWRFDVDGNIVKSVVTEHVYKDGLCSNCGVLQTVGLIYELRADGESYKVTGYKGTATEIYVAKEYKGLPVTEIGASAFWRYGNSSNFTNYNVTKVVLPTSVTKLADSCFRQLAELETVIAPGVTKIDTPVDGGMQFYDCVKLKTIVLGESFTATENAANWNNSRVFFADAAAVKTDIYLSSIDGGTNIYSPNDRNSMLSGNVYYYCVKDCLNTWKYDGGNVVKSTVTEHSYEGGYCSNCGALQTQGVIYTLKEDGQSYMITGYSGAETELYFANVYRGKPVTELKASTFFNNKNIKKVVFGKNLTKIGGYNFMFCDNLETVIAPGVTYIDTTAETGESGMHFHACAKLKTVVFGDSITIGGPNRCFSIDGGDDTVVYAGVNIYLTSADGTLTAKGIGHTSSQNRMLSQDRVFHYSATEKAGFWHYDANGMPVMW